jgi:HK97 family phage portal protein
MALSDIALRAAGMSRAGRRPAVSSSKPPAGALADPIFSTVPHQPMWSAYNGPESVTYSRRNIYAARAIEHIANSIAGLPFCAGNMTSRIARPTTAMQQLLGPAPGSPNPLWSAAKLWRWSVKQWLILGKFAWLHEYDDSGRIVALWPLMAQYLIPVIADPKAGHYFEGYRYGTQGSAGYREFGTGDVTYIWNPSQHDVRQPESPLDLAKYAINIATLLDQFDMGFLTNGGVPAHLVTTGRFGDQTSRRAFRAQFGSKFGGARNTGKTMFAERDLEEGDYGAAAPSDPVDVKIIGQSQKDSELSKLRDAKIQDICVDFGVPLSLLGYSADSKYTNMELDRANYWIENVKPKLSELEDGVNIALGALLDGPKDIGWFDTSSIPELRKPPVFSEAGGIAAVEAGLITPNQYLDDRGMPPSDDPDADKLRKQAPAAVKGGLPAQPATSPLAGPDGVTDPEPPPVPPLRKVAAVRTDLLDVVRAQLSVELDAQRGELVARLAGKRGGKNRAHAQLDLSLVYDREHWAKRMATNLGPALRAAGMDDVGEWSEDVTAAVFERLSDQQTLDVFDVDDGMARLDAWQSGGSHQLEAGFVESVLVGIGTGGMSAADALGAIGAA